MSDFGLWMALKGQELTMNSLWNAGFFEEEENIFRGKTICVTGGLGSIGSELVKGLLKLEPKAIVVIDNRETELFYARTYLSDPRIRYEFADVRDYNSILPIIKGVDIIFHAAAMKHVVMCENAPLEAIKTNLLGTQNVIEAAVNCNVQKVIFISTDKSVNPCNVMGTTKLLAERLISGIATHGKNGNTKFGIVRFGNVLNSRGSVLEVWSKQLSLNGKITLTKGNMTRFFMNTAQCVKLIFKAAKFAEYGEIFVLKMPSVRINDFAKAFLKIKGYPLTSITMINSKPGEKIHEELLLRESNYQVLENDELFVMTQKKVDELKKEGFKETKIEKFSSDNPEHILKPEKIKTLILNEDITPVGWDSNVTK